MKLFLLLLFFSLSCSLNAQLEFYDCPKQKKYKYALNANLYTRQMLGKDSFYLNWRIVTGDSIVLKYEHYFDCSGNGHFGVFANFIWSIPSTSTKFKIQLNKGDLRHTPLLYSTSCGPPCKEYNFEMVDADGSVQGDLIKGVWHVTGSINATLRHSTSSIVASKRIIVNGDYTLWKQSRKDRKGHKFYGF